MLHQNSVFHGLLKLVPWHRLERFVAKHAADELSRKLDTKRQLVALLFGQFSGAASLREIVTGMASHETRLYHLGAAPVKRSTLSDANTERPGKCLASCSRRCCRKPIAGCGGQPAKQSGSLIHQCSAVQPERGLGHIFERRVWGQGAYRLRSECRSADYFAVTPANVNDITAAKVMPIEAAATYVYDLGYYDYGWWAQLDDHGCRFVTRLKKNTPFIAVHENRVAHDSSIVSDRIGHLPARLAASRRTRCRCRCGKSG